MIFTHLVLLKLLEGASAGATSSVAPATQGASDIGGMWLNARFIPPGLSQIYNLRERTN